MCMLVRVQNECSNINYVIRVVRRLLNNNHNWCVITINNIIIDKKNKRKQKRRRGKCATDNDKTIKTDNGCRDNWSRLSLMNSVHKQNNKLNIICLECQFSFQTKRNKIKGSSVCSQTSWTSLKQHQPLSKSHFTSTSCILYLVVCACTCDWMCMANVNKNLYSEKCAPNTNSVRSK